MGYSRRSCKPDLLVGISVVKLTQALSNLFDLKVQSAKASPLHSEKLKYVLLFPRFFVTLPINSRTYSVSAKKEQILLFCSRLFVILEEIAGFLYIKAMQRIEKIQGYGIESFLNSMFCYKLPKRAPDS